MDLNHDIIKSNPYFNSLNNESYSKLAQQIAVLNLHKNEVLFREGDFADAFYVVAKGAVRITTINVQGKTIFLARIAEGGFFGEQAFSSSSSSRRQAAAMAQMDTVCNRSRFF
jgi:CRP/FNR family transcriptional regulator